LLLQISLPLPIDINYLKEKFYIGNKLEELIKDNNIDNSSNNSIDKSSNKSIDNTNNINKWYYLAITMIVISGGIVIYLYYNNNDNPDIMDLLKGIKHLKNIHNDNDSLLDTILDDSGYFY